MIKDNLSQLLIALVMLLVTGCAEYTAAIGEAGAKAAHDKWEVSEWDYCDANSTGELLRQGEAERNAYIAHCLAIKGGN